MDIKKPLSRRNFLKHSAVVVGSVSILSKIIYDNDAYAQALTALEETNPTALALGYKHDGSLVDVAKFPKKAGEQGQKANCSNCMFFSQGGQKIAGQEGEYGKCTLFPTALVNSKGWCNSWALKPGTTL